MNYLLEQEKYVENLPKNIKDSLLWYTTDEYRDFNYRITNNIVLSSAQRRHLDNITTAFYDVPPTKNPISVYR